MKTNIEHPTSNVQLRTGVDDILPPMKTVACCFAIYLLVLARVTHANTPATTQTTQPDWKLTWSDEFNGTGIDRTKWDFDMGTGFYTPPKDGKPGQWSSGWGNNELEFYTDRNKNAFVKDGMLHLRAIKEEYKGAHYTSAKMRTGGRGEMPLFTQKYGRFEFRAKLPVGKGLWPAIWLLPQNDLYGGWAASGEIDLMEARGKYTDIVQGTLHYGGSSPKNVWHGQQYRLPDSGSIADFHVYTLEWEPGEIRMSVDDKIYFTRNFWWSRTGDAANPWPAPFDQPFYIILNVAVGGNFGGDPDNTTVFPQEMVVDYVRVYEKANADSSVKPRGPGNITDKSQVQKADK